MILFLAIISIAYAATGHGDTHAEITMTGQSGNTCSGTITMKMVGAVNKITYDLKNCGVASERSIHIHEGSTCAKVGGHFNPTNAELGTPAEIGDLDPVTVAADGSVTGTVDEKLALLTGNNNIDKRTIVLHGIDGSKISCGPITVHGEKSGTNTVLLSAFLAAIGLML